ncbi:MAG: helix-turn-helix domain-containing protein [Trueperaceae bacterium]|nr:helix-turn-helix domain-containing protein [Trueperaceae bacterium]
MTTHDSQQNLPPRLDGVDTWKRQHLHAAKRKAQGWRWPRIAEELGFSHGTVKNYKLIDGWDGLVDHFAEKFFQEEIDRLFYQGSVDALNALRDQFEAGVHEVEQLERDIAAGEADEGALDQLYSRSKATTYSADKYLKSIGFTRYRQRRAEMQAEEEVQGTPGQTVRHEGGDRPIRYEVEDDEALEIAGILDDLGALPDPDGEAEGADDPEE